jgi:hypothetical protein
VEENNELEFFISNGEVGITFRSFLYGKSDGRCKDLEECYIDDCNFHSHGGYILFVLESMLGPDAMAWFVRGALRSKGDVCVKVFDHKGHRESSRTFKFCSDKVNPDLLRPYRDVYSYDVEEELNNSEQEELLVDRLNECIDDVLVKE